MVLRTILLCSFFVTTMKEVRAESLRDRILQDPPKVQNLTKTECYTRCGTRCWIQQAGKWVAVPIPDNVQVYKSVHLMDEHKLVMWTRARK